MRRSLILQMLSIAFLFVVLSISASLAQDGQNYRRDFAGIAKQVSDQINASNFLAVAVLDFTDVNGQVSALGRVLAEELSVNLVLLSKKYNVVDRTHLNTVISEHKLSYKGIIADQNDAKRLGNIAGVNALVIGTITILGDQLRVYVKILDTESARVTGAALGAMDIDQHLAELARTELSTSITEKYEAASLNSIEIVPKRYEGHASTIIFDKLEVTPLGKLRGEFIIIANRDTYFYAIFKLKEHTFISDESGNKYFALGCEGIRTIDRDKVSRRRDTSPWTRFPKGVPTRFSIIFDRLREMPKTLYFSCIFNGFAENNEFHGSGSNMSLTITDIKIK